MATRTAILVAVPVALLGGAVVVRSSLQVSDLGDRVAEQEAAGLSAGASFVRTFEAEAVARQFQALDRRRALAASLAEARRNRLLGLLALAAAGLGGAGAVALSRISREIEEDRALVEEERGRLPR